MFKIINNKVVSTKILLQMYVTTDFRGERVTEKKWPPLTKLQLIGQMLAIEGFCSNKIEAGDTHSVVVGDQITTYEVKIAN